MRRLGVHTSISGGLPLSLKRAYLLGCNTVQIFTHNPRGWKVKPISEKDIVEFKSIRKQFNISPVYVHTSYLINMASWDNLLRRKAIELLISEMDRADMIDADFTILHPGSASGIDEKLSRKRAIDTLNEVAKRGQWKNRLLIENTSGKKGDISPDMKSLSEILNGVKGKLISGICLDTCHAFASGYNICNFKGIVKIADEIKRYIGIEKIKLIHLNDSKADIGSGVDRHEHIGFGKIGKKGLKEFLQYKYFKDIPVILETPKKSELDDIKNLKVVRQML